ncbi:MAG TPA: hypothetical protein ENK58_00790 [Desulfobacterales bacterium]|nr:hypothetical protein [Desulfobacterales bacterium]
MTEEEAPKKIKVDYYIDLVLRRRWLIIIPFCLSMLAGIYLSITLPRQYSADTLILIVPKSIPDRFVEPLTETPVQQRVSTITEQVKSRTYIERIIKEVGLYSGPEYKNMLLEEKIAGVRKNIRIVVTRGRKGTDAFKISFEGKEPEKITKAVQVLANFFIDESIKVMQSEVMEAQNFLESELKSKSDKLVEVETDLKNYRTKNMGGLPEQLNSNLSMLTGLRDQLNSKQESLRDENIRRIQLEGQRAEVRRELENFDPDIVPDEIVKKSEPQEVVQLRRVKEQYAGLTSRYTQRHPDVIKMKQMVVELEAKVAEIAEKIAQTPKPELPKKKSKADMMVAKYRAAKEHQLKELKAQHEESLRMIKRHNEDISKLSEQISIYEKRVEDTPKREQELMSLIRDYKNIQDSYNSLLERKLDADIAVSMERKSKGQRFRVLDKAKVPQKPISPDLKILLAVSLLGGLAFGGGLVFLLDLLDTSLRRPEDIESLMEVPVLATVPNIYYRPIDRLKQRLDQGLSIFFIMIGTGLLAVFGVLAMKGVEGAMTLGRKVLAKIPFIG